MTSSNNIAAIAAITPPQPLKPVATVEQWRKLDRNTPFSYVSIGDVLPFSVNEELGLPDTLVVEAYGHSHHRMYSYSSVREDFAYHLILPRYRDYSAGQNKVELSPRAIAAVTGFDYRLADNAMGGVVWYHHPSSHLRQVVVTFRAKMVEFTMGMDFQLAQNLLGATITDDLHILVNGVKYPAPDLSRLSGMSLDFYGYGREGAKFDFTWSTLKGVKRFVGSQDAETIKTVVQASFIKQGVENVPPVNGDGISKVLKTVQPLADQLFTTDLASYIAFRTIATLTKRSVEGVKVSTWFNETFGGAKSPADIQSVVAPYVADNDFEKQFRASDYFRAKRKEFLKNSTGRAFSKLMEDKDFLNLDRKKYPLLDAAIEAGDVPVSVFFRKEEQYFLLNGNFALWEEMLKKHRDVTVEIAKNAAGRSKFEKDLMSYFYFVLYALPEYLKKHTKKKWKCIPKLVDSQYELDAPEGDDSGTVRQRSALTPVADNENNTVVVPYAALRISGVRVQYCYSHDYHVLQRGFSFNGNAVMEDLEEKLNGKDDYGLMFYTLTGTETAKGYPTFLIIFEKRAAGVHVHFHRTHPSRSKGGDYNPIHDWIKVCYNWMAGNVHRSKLKVQQGDLIFAETDKAPDDGYALGQQYDNHTFDEPVEIAPYSGKDKSVNILGWVKIVKETRLLHKEHDAVTLRPGVYEIRQCRSWEANPRGIWSLRID
jgi:hypothetical protein